MRRRHRSLRGATCSTTPTLTRGLVGGLAGAAAGGLVGFVAVALLMPKAQAAINNGADPTSTPIVMAPLALPILGLAGTAAGVAIAIHKPGC